MHYGNPNFRFHNPIHTGFHGEYLPGYTQNIEYLNYRIEQLCSQIAVLTEHFARRSFGEHTGFGTRPHETSFGRIRENGTHFFWELSLPNLSLGELEVEVFGNRVVCRTRVPFRGFADLPRGVDCFELPDGRVELSWAVPVAFVTREVEANWREGGITITVPKAEGSARHTVKIGKDSSNGVRKHEMTA